MQEIGNFNPYNGVTSEICTVYLATDLTPGEARPDDTEEFELVRCVVSDFEAWICENKVWDGMTLAAWMLLKCRWPHAEGGT